MNSSYAYLSLSAGIYKKNTELQTIGMDGRGVHLSERRGGGFVLWRDLGTEYFKKDVNSPILEFHLISE